MIKQIAWNTFKNTGNINTYIEYMQLKNIEEQIKADNNGNNKNNRNNINGK